MTNDALANGLSQAGVLPLFYADDTQLCKDILLALYQAGIRYVEFTNRGKNALHNFSALVEMKAQLPDLYLGVGTIHDAEQAAAFLDAGADFLVSPFFDASIADYTYMQKKLWIPGCMTPTEIHQAVAHGCQLVKLFPGEVLGTAFVKAVKPLFNHVTFIVTGGVSPERENIRQWLSAGAAILGMGSKLIQPAQLENEQALLALRNATRQVVDIIQAYKNQPHG
jgi:2-dehydro-3-deoxyphosphogluconate aldolase/(4S)-4-hydroxy-2-oxoglutarate aldolase